jgi:hypothetical protein
MHFFGNQGFTDGARHGHLYLLASKLNHGCKDCANARFVIDVVAPYEITVTLKKNVEEDDEILLDCDDSRYYSVCRECKFRRCIKYVANLGHRLKNVLKPGESAKGKPQEEPGKDNPQEEPGEDRPQEEENRPRVEDTPQDESHGEKSSKLKRIWKKKPAKDETREKEPLLVRSKSLEGSNQSIIDKQDSRHEVHGAGLDEQNEPTTALEGTISDDGVESKSADTRGSVSG